MNQAINPLGDKEKSPNQFTDRRKFDLKKQNRNQAKNIPRMQTIDQYIHEEENLADTSTVNYAKDPKLKKAALLQQVEKAKAPPLQNP
ncbi:MAG: hypothetical protein K0S74_1543 [Chlamydiales bacterium]|jgi:cell fate (sporulation/competence/biofilm development) regulator YmcA (YheA/YmcA/DUF963 family)|nr:hypothetical protein [Chlamydiales bacterium]